MIARKIKGLYVLGALTLALPLLAASGQEKKKPETYSAVVVGAGGAIGAASMNIDIRIDRHTTDEEMTEYINLLKEKGQDALRRKLEKVDVGNIRPSVSVGTDLAIARVLQTPEGKVIRLLSARGMSFLELYRSGRSTDYPFTIVEIRIDPDGKGAGTIIGGAQVSIDKEILEIESLGNQYAKLANVRAWD